MISSASPPGPASLTQVLPATGIINPESALPLGFSAVLIGKVAATHPDNPGIVDGLKAEIPAPSGKDTGKDTGKILPVSLPVETRLLPHDALKIASVVKLTDRVEDAAPHENDSTPKKAATLTDFANLPPEIVAEAPVITAPVITAPVITAPVILVPSQTQPALLHPMRAASAHGAATQATDVPLGESPVTMADANSRQPQATVAAAMPMTLQVGGRSIRFETQVSGVTNTPEEPVPGKPINFAHGLFPEPAVQPAKPDIQRKAMSPSAMPVRMTHSVTAPPSTSAESFKPIVPAAETPEINAAAPAWAPVPSALHSPAPEVPGSSTVVQPHDFSALVDRLVEARHAAQAGQGAQTVTAAFRHAEFGAIAMQFDTRGEGLSVSLSSADPDFNRVALAAATPAASSGNLAQSGQDSAGQQASANTSGQAQSQNPGQQRQQSARQPDLLPQHNSPSARRDARDVRDAQTSGQDGLFA